MTETERPGTPPEAASHSPASRKGPRRLTCARPAANLCPQGGTPVPGGGRRIARHGRTKGRETRCRHPEKGKKTEQRGVFID